MVSADVPAGALVREDVELGSSTVRLPRRWRWPRWRRSTWTAPTRPSEMAAAADVVEEALAGDPDAQFTVDGAEDHELEWYAVAELDELA